MKYFFLIKVRNTGGFIITIKLSFHSFTCTMTKTDILISLSNRNHWHCIKTLHQKNNTSRRTRVTHGIRQNFAIVNTPRNKSPQFFFLTWVNRGRLQLRIPTSPSNRWLCRPSDSLYGWGGELLIRLIDYKFRRDLPHILLSRFVFCLSGEVSFYVVEKECAM